MKNLKYFLLFNYLLYPFLYLRTIMGRLLFSLLILLGTLFAFENIYHLFIFYLFILFMLFDVEIIGIFLSKSIEEYVEDSLIQIGEHIKKIFDEHPEIKMPEEFNISENLVYSRNYNELLLSSNFSFNRYHIKELIEVISLCSIYGQNRLDLDEIVKLNKDYVIKAKKNNLFIFNETIIEYNLYKVNPFFDYKNLKSLLKRKEEVSVPMVNSSTSMIVKKIDDENIKVEIIKGAKSLRRVTSVIVSKDNTFNYNSESLKYYSTIEEELENIQIQ